MPISRTVTYTHKGWFLLCPVYLANLESAGPDVLPRIDFLTWLLYLSEVLYGLLVEAICFVRPDYEPMFPLMVTGQLKNPLTLTFAE